MVQTAAGASNNAWIQYQKECAKRYKEEKSSAKSAGGAVRSTKGQTKASAKARGKAASPTNAQKPRRRRQRKGRRRPKLQS